MCRLVARVDSFLLVTGAGEARFGCFDSRRGLFAFHWCMDAGLVLLFAFFAVGGVVLFDSRVTACRSCDGADFTFVFVVQLLAVRRLCDLCLCS